MGGQFKGRLMKRGYGGEFYLHGPGSRARAKSYAAPAAKQKGKSKRRYLAEADAELRRMIARGVVAP